jgi:ABC-type phosphate/phosphonate transport system substrate-binding protein
VHVSTELPRRPVSPIANARMYSVTPQVKAAWKEVLGWALARARLDWPVLDYDPPAPLDVLWARDDLGCAMMCGLPFSERRPPPTLLAAPVPSPGRYQGRPIYFTDIAVRADSAHRTLEDTFGGVVGYTLENSMSGCVALRRHLLAHRTAERPRLYRRAVGGLLNARRVIEALDEGRIDVGPLDSYAHDLLRRNDPAFAGKIRVIASTAAAPIPPLVATAPIAADELGRLREGVVAAGGAAELGTAREVLLLEGFVVPRKSDYDAFNGILAASRQFPGTW